MFELVTSLSGCRTDPRLDWGKEPHAMSDTTGTKAMRTCPTCGHKRAVNATACASCGKPAAEWADASSAPAGPPPSVAPPASPGPGWWLASDGQWYPPQPAHAPPPPAQAPYQAPPQAVLQPVLSKKGHGCLYAVLGGFGVVAAIVILVVVLVTLGANRLSNNLSRMDNAGNIGGPAPTVRYKLGDTATTSGFQVTVYAVKDPQAPAQSFITPQPGTHFVSVDVQVANPFKNPQTFSSLIGFHLLDSQDKQYGEEISNGGLTPGPPEGQIAPGQSVRGFVVFQVPEATAGLKLRVQGSLTAVGAVWALS